MAEWLFEILSEEIPARMQPGAEEQIKDLAETLLHEHHIGFGIISSYVTPRRLTLLVEGLRPQQLDRTEEKRGPRVDAPEQAINGFLSGLGITLKDCERRATPKGDFLFYSQNLKGKETREALPELALQILKRFQWPKSMRWGSYTETWVRPIRGILSIYNGTIVPMEYAGVKSSNKTLGHRFMSTGEIAVNGFEDYQSKLLKAKVIIDWHERRKLIKEKLESLASKHSVAPVPDDALLDEVTGLAEWPVINLGQIEKEFLELPKEVITTPMRIHQRYFPMLDGSHLSSWFGVISNTETKGDLSIDGYGKVLKARLADARFFWEQDKKHPLQSYNAQLAKRLFHQNLGTIEDKVERLKTAATILKNKNICGQKLIEVAALCKADLATKMVGEFPEVQGVMGKYYAISQGIDSEIANAIEQHYWPIGADGDLPKTQLATIMGLIDRMDNLVGFFSIGIKPTGSKDPFGLRRSALGILRLFESLDRNIDLSVKDLISQAYDSYDWSKCDLRGVKKLDKVEVIQSVWEFLLERFKFYLREKQGTAYDHVDAVLAIANKSPDFRSLTKRVESLDKLLASENGINLLAAYKRASQILRIEERNDNCIYGGDVEQDLLTSPAELNLYEEMARDSSVLEDKVKLEDFEGSMIILSKLRPHVDAFFDTVTVNDSQPAIRRNRLELLSMIRNTLHLVADFSKIEG